MSTSCENHQVAYLEGVREAEDHVLSCARCQAAATELDEIRRALAAPTVWEEPDPSLESRVVAAVERAAMDARAIRDDTRGARVTSIAQRRRLRDRLRLPLPALGLVAAALLVGVVVGGGVMRIVDRGPASNAQFALAGTPLAPRAGGRADVRNDANGVEIKFHVHGLPRAPAGFYYQAWVKGDKGLVPIGTFHTGEGEVVLWSGVSLDRYRTITVTLQQEGGDQASSGKRVLVGQLPRR